MQDLVDSKVAWAKIVPMVAKVSMATSRKLLLMTIFVVVARHEFETHPARILRKSGIHTGRVLLIGTAPQKEADQ